mgnify:CR=1 FL=1
MPNKIKNNSCNHMIGDGKITACGLKIDTFTTAYNVADFTDKNFKCKKCAKIHTALKTNYPVS